jgi:hypothetical protein
MFEGTRVRHLVSRVPVTGALRVQSSNDSGRATLYSGFAFGFPVGARDDYKNMRFGFHVISEIHVIYRLTWSFFLTNHIHV